jgi:hypothetical protein
MRGGGMKDRNMLYCAEDNEACPDRGIQRQQDNLNLDVVRTTQVGGCEHMDE